MCAELTRARARAPARIGELVENDVLLARAEVLGAARIERTVDDERGLLDRHAQLHAAAHAEGGDRLGGGGDGRPDGHLVHLHLAERVCIDRHVGCESGRIDHVAQPHSAGRRLVLALGERQARDGALEHAHGVADLSRRRGERRTRTCTRIGAHERLVGEQLIQNRGGA